MKKRLYVRRGISRQQNGGNAPDETTNSSNACSGAPAGRRGVFSFNDVRKSPARGGYRPAHRLTDTCLTTGVHYYYDVGSVPPGASARGTITFLSPEAYPHCLWVGKRIPMQEGAHVVGYAVITRIDNPLLQAEKPEARASVVASPDHNDGRKPR